MSKDEKELKALRDQQELEILRRVLFWLGAAVLLEALVLLANRFYFHALTSKVELSVQAALYELFGVLQFAGVVVGLGFFVWAVLGRKQNPRSGICRFICAAFFVSISVCAFLFLHVGNGCVSILLAGIPAMAGLIMIYYLYQREFFVLATVSGLGMLGLWIFRTASARYLTFYYIYTIVVALLVAAVVILSRKVQKEKGYFTWGNHKFEIVKPDANYKTVWFSCAFAVACLALAPILGSVFAYYAFIAMVVWIFIMAVYFTSRLM